jgi:hypothetical protein
MIGWSDGELAWRLNVSDSKVGAWSKSKSNILLQFSTAHQ